jgi:hypothetical protein
VRGNRVLEDMANCERDIREDFNRLLGELQDDPTSRGGAAPVRDRTGDFYSARFDKALLEYKLYVDERSPGIDLIHVHWYSPPTRIK